MIFRKTVKPVYSADEKQWYVIITYWFLIIPVYTTKELYGGFMQ
jgi:hypothetical protein